MASASNIQRGTTPRPGEPITSKAFADLANATTAARQILGPAQPAGAVFTAGGIVEFPGFAQKSNAVSLLPFRPYQVPNPDDPGTPWFGITPGSISDSTNAGMTWFPTLNDPDYGPTAINVIVGSPARYPYQVLSTDATIIYFNSTIVTDSGNISASEIDGDTGGGQPASTNIAWYLNLSSVVVTVTSGVASIAFGNDGFCNAPLIYAICEGLPLADGAGYRWGT